MEKKKILIISAITCAVVFFGIGLIKNKETNNNVSVEETNIQKAVKNDTTVKKEKQDKIININAVKKSENKISPIQAQEQGFESTRINLYNEIPSSSLPLSAISEISNLSENIRNSVAKIAKNRTIYMIQKKSDKLFIITDNPENIRHSVEFTEINISNGHQTHTTLGYNDRIKDSENDIWEYHTETKQPLRHTKYDSKGDMEFVEEWNYDSDNPVKYQMKNSDGKIISIKKETLQGGTDLRIEHLLYDKDGNTKVNVSASYNGEDIKRFTYYNADKPNESGSVFSDYSDGLKTKETVYTSDLKVKNTYTSDYKDGERLDITKWSSENKEIEKLLPIEEL